MESTVSESAVGESTHEDALRQADTLAGREVRETEVRCAVLAQFIADCERKSARTAAWNEAILELRALQERRAGLMRRRDLIQQALACPVGESRMKSPLSPETDRNPVRIQRQMQVQRQRRRS